MNLGTETFGYKGKHAMQNDSHKQVKGNGSSKGIPDLNIYGYKRKHATQNDSPERRKGNESSKGIAEKHTH